MYYTISVTHTYIYNLWYVIQLIQCMHYIFKYFFLLEHLFELTLKHYHNQYNIIVEKVNYPV